MLVLAWGMKIDFVGRLFAGIAKGVEDEAVSQFTNTEVSVASGLRDILIDCEPWSQHLTADGIKQMNEAIKRGNEGLAREVIDKSLTETSAPWCINTLKTAVVLVCTKCPSILKEALPSSYY
jgi:hypothetical protein